MEIEKSKFKLNPWWVTGIADSEGHFGIGFNSKTNTIQPQFKVTQKIHSENILWGLKDFFGVGSITWDNKKEKAYKYIVYKHDDLNRKIIPHFSNYPLVTSKYLDFLDFEKVVTGFNDKKAHLDSILGIKKGMNNGRSSLQRWSYLNERDLILKPEWVQSFIEGEGSFQFNISNTLNRGKKYISTSATLEIAQSNHDVRVLDWIKNFFQVGYLKPKFDINEYAATSASRSVSRLVINQSKDVIAFIDDYPMFGVKRLDYEDWKQLISLKEEKGNTCIPEMLYIKRQMNRGRFK